MAQGDMPTPARILPWLCAGIRRCGHVTLDTAQGLGQCPCVIVGKHHMRHPTGIIKNLDPRPRDVVHGVRKREGLPQRLAPRLDYRFLTGPACGEMHSVAIRLKPAAQGALPQFARREQPAHAPVGLRELFGEDVQRHDIMTKADNTVPGLLPIHRRHRRHRNA